MDSDKVKGLMLRDVLGDFPVQWPGVENAMYPEQGYGLCDDEMWRWGSRSGAVGFRMDQVLLPLTLVAATSLGWAAGATMPFFGSKGQGEFGGSGYPATYVLTESETNAFKTGAMVWREDEQFFIFSLGFQVSKPEEMDAAAPLAPIAVENMWLRGYERKIQEKIADKFAAIINWPDTKCEYGGAKLKLWPTHSDTVGSDIVAMSNRAGMLGLLGLRGPVIGGYRTGNDALVINAKAGFAASWLNDAAFPIPAMAANHSIVAPVTCLAYGVAQKRNRCIICVGGVAANVDDLVTEIIRRMGNRQLSKG